MLTPVDLSPNNILVGALDDATLSQIEKDEQESPSGRKELSDRTIYMSKKLPFTAGDPVISDLGSSRFGQETYIDDIMPGIYRAPEVILEMEWSCKVDMWSIGVMVIRFWPLSVVLY